MGSANPLKANVIYTTEYKYFSMLMNTFSLAYIFFNAKEEFTLVKRRGNEKLYMQKNGII